MTTPCPNCGTPVELGTSPREIAVCPGCRAVVRAQTTAAVHNAANWRTTSIVLKSQFAILLIFIVATAASFGSIQFGPGDDTAAACVGCILVLIYFLCLCLCGSAPDPTARRSALACILTLVFGSIGLIAGAAFANGLRPLGASHLIEAALGFGVFAVYYSAFVFLMRFHTAIARRFGDRRLRLHCFAYMFAPLVAIAVNAVFLWLTEPFAFGREGAGLFGETRRIVRLTQTVFNFAVVLYYAILLFWTSGTIDRGPAKPGESDLPDAADDDLPID
jgi:hypothetical protein